MNSNIFNEKKIDEKLIEKEEYYLIKYNSAYKIIIGIILNKLIIKCKNYETILNLSELEKNKLKFNTINEAYEYIIKIFEENKVIIDDIISFKSINISLKVDFEENIKIVLLYNKKNKNLINNNNNENEDDIQLKKRIDDLWSKCDILEIEIDKLKSFCNKLNCDLEEKIINNDKKLNNKKNINNNSDPKDIQISINLIKNSLVKNYLDNTFSVFNSINNILYLIYTNEEKSIISYNLITNKKIIEIKNAHDEYISNFRHYLDNINKRDLLLSLSSTDNNIKLWNINNLDCLLDLKNINQNGYLRSACFLNDNNQLFIASSSDNWNYSESIKIYDFNGNKIKEIDESKQSTYFISNYYDKKLSKNYILTGNDGYVKSFDYDNNKIYHIYKDKGNISHNSIVVNQNEEIIKLIESCEDGKIRIWNFHTGTLLNKIKINDSRLYGICLWNNDYLFIGGTNGIILLELNNGTILENLTEKNNCVVTIKKIMHPIYGECLLSQNVLNSSIKLWINKNRV